MKIGELAGQAGVSMQTVRFYERRRLEQRIFALDKSGTPWFDETWTGSGACQQVTCRMALV